MEEQRVVVFLEPIALYMTRDLDDEKDAGWAFDYPAPDDDAEIKLGDIHTHGTGKDLCIITYGNGYYLSRKAEKALKADHDLNIRIIDLRWLGPMNVDAVCAAAAHCDSILAVDECRETASLSEEIMTKLYENMDALPPMKRVTATDCFIPLGKAYASTLPSVDKIIDAATSITKSNKRKKSA